MDRPWTKRGTHILARGTHIREHGKDILARGRGGQNTFGNSGTSYKTLYHMRFTNHRIIEVQGSKNGLFDPNSRKAKVFCDLNLVN